MTSRTRRALGLFAAFGARLAAGQTPSSAAPSPSPSPSVQPAPAPSPAPAPPTLRSSVERVVERIEAGREDPCRRAAAEGQPCFPVDAIQRGPEASVRETFRDLGPADKWSPGRPPTVDEMAEYRPGPGPPRGTFLNVDPGCIAKSVVKQLKGGNDAYYVYRIRDVHGDRVAMYDRRLEASTFQGNIELVGRFQGECAALAAYREERQKLARPAPPAPPR